MVQIRHMVVRCRDPVLVFALALMLRLIFSAFLADTFDKNEFVYLALGHDVAHGAIPYRDFAFLHPPGVLVVLAALDPLSTLWWPLTRLVDALIDCGTAILVWRIGLHLFGRREALAAGILYAANPVVLVSAVRVDQEAIMTALGVAGLALLLLRRSSGAAILAGLCLALATWIKYPMLVFLPVYCLAAPRRMLPCLTGFLAGTAILFSPFVLDGHQLYQDSIAWQLFHRNRTPLNTRLETVAIFWLLVSPFAVAALLRGRKPLWLVVWFASGGVFLFTSAVYSPYFVPIMPAASLLGAPLAAGVVRVSPRAMVLSALVIAIAWGIGIRAFAGEQGYVIASRFSAIRPIVRFIDQSTPRNTPILGNRFEYAFIAGRPWIAHYFWDQHTFVTAADLIRRLSADSVVVAYPDDYSSAYPIGLLPYLTLHYASIEMRDTTIWRVTPHRRNSTMPRVG